MPMRIATDRAHRGAGGGWPPDRRCGRRIKAGGVTVGSSPSAARPVQRQVATKVLRNTTAAVLLAASAGRHVEAEQTEPQQMAPIAASVRLCGFIGSWANQGRFDDDQREGQACSTCVDVHTVPPAKSIAGVPAGRGLRRSSHRRTPSGRREVDQLVAHHGGRRNQPGVELHGRRPHRR